MRYVTVLLAAVLTLAACGGKTPSANTAPEPATHTAGQIANTMAIGRVTVWTAATDENKLLGRPGGYTSAATTVDSRLDCTEVATSCGATIEVFPTPDQAVARSQYIQSLLGGILGTEYHTVIGSVLLRVTGQLTPDQAKVYADKFDAAAQH